MGVQSDIELVREGYEAFTAGDLVWLNEHMHENIVWHVAGHNALSGDHRGRENVLAFFAKGVQIAVPEFDIHDVLGSEDHVVVLLEMRLRRNDNGDTFDDRGVTVFHLDNEQVLEVWTLQEHQAELDRFLEGVA